MNIVRILPQILINQIAAGEVIERPASVIKELVENCIDAKATSIEIVIRQGGASYIAINDNGCGMSKQDLELCVERHATSKLSNNNLFNIQSMGFRGEALPSIGSIARLQITSKDRHQEHAWILKVNGGEKHPLKPASLAYGTKVEVSDLFFATPARLKFLKSATTEINYIINMVKSLAMVNPSINFSLNSDNKNLLNYTVTTSEHQTLATQRVCDIISKEFIDNAIPLNIEQAQITIKGFIGLPTLNRANTQHQYLFVNNRPVKDKILQHAIKISYNDFLAKDRYPIIVLFLQIDPMLVDINVHPAKAEVRFRDPGKVRSIVISSIQAGLKQGGFKASSTIAAQALSAMQWPSKHHSQPTFPIGNNLTDNSDNTKILNKAVENKPRTSLIYTQLQENNANIHLSNNNTNITQLDDSHATKPIAEQADDFAMYPLGLAKTQLHDTYVVAQSAAGIVIVDQHAVHERIVYESMKESIANDNLKIQTLLVPEVINLTEEQCNILLNFSDNLSKLGLLIETFGKDAILVRAIPAILQKSNIKQIIIDIVDELSEQEISLTLNNHVNKILSSISCHGSIRAGQKLSIEEMNALLRQMEATPYAGQCNHGRPTYVELHKKDIEKLFGRR